MRGPPLDRRPASITPVMPASAPAIAKAVIFVMRTFTPDAQVAASPEPMALL